MFAQQVAPAVKGTFRNWIFTVNNPQYTPEALLQFLAEVPNVRYCIFQQEIAPTTATLHYQGYVEFHKPVRLTTGVKVVKNAHLEPRRGTQEQAIAYCSKDESRVPNTEPYIYGTPAASTKPGSKPTEDAVKIMLESGELAVLEAHPTIWLRHHRALRELKRLKTPQRDWEMNVYVYYGPTGCGKSRAAFTFYPEAYWKPRNLFWDGYEGQETIIIDDFYGWLPYDFMLRLLDRYPLILDVKHGTAQCVARTIVITSNKHPSRWYTEESHPYDPLKRRITEIIDFTEVRPDLPDLSLDLSRLACDPEIKNSQ